MSCTNCSPKESAIKLFKALVGVDCVLPAVQRQRYEQCAACQHLIKSALPSFSRCGLCGATVAGVKVNCFVSAKTKLAKERCQDVPARWDRIS